MQFGEKIQILRKQKNLSQEELALQLAIPEESVSEWELNISAPSIENILQLSTLFDVSIDYLLKDEICSESNMSDSLIEAEQENAVQGRLQMSSAYSVGIGLIVIGFLIRLMNWQVFQTESAIWIGFAMQVCGILAFELLLEKCILTDKSLAKRKFYAISIWLVCPCTPFFYSTLIFSIFPRPYYVPVIIYFLICSVTTYFLLRKHPHA